MFRAVLCPSSGAPSNCLCSHWLPYNCRVGRASISLSRIHRSTCFGQCCAHHQEPPPTAFAATGYRIIAGLDVLLFLCRVYTAQHVSGSVVPIIRSPLQLPLQPLVTV